MKRSEADILANQLLSFGELPNPLGAGSFISGQSYNAFFDMPDNGTFLTGLQELSYLGVNLYRAWLGGAVLRENYYYPSSLIKPGCIVRYNGRRIARQGERFGWYIPPEGIFNIKNGENDSWKVLNFPCSMGEWEEEEIRFPDAPQFSPSTLRINAGTIVGRGEEVRIPNLSKLLKVEVGDGSDRKAENKPLGLSSYRVNGGEVSANLAYPQYWLGNRVTCKLYPRPYHTSSEGWQIYQDNPSITARIYLCPTEEVTPEDLLTSHKFVWQAAFVKAYMLGDKDGLYSLFPIDKWIEYMTIYETRVKGKSVYSSSIGNAGLTEEQIASNNELNEATKELSKIWSNALFLWTSASAFYGDFTCVPIGREFIDSRQKTLERGVTYNVIVELDNFIGQPEFTTLTILRSEHKRRAMKIRI